MTILDPDPAGESLPTTPAGLGAAKARLDASFPGSDPAGSGRAGSGLAGPGFAGSGLAGSDPVGSGLAGSADHDDADQDDADYDDADSGARRGGLGRRFLHAIAPVAGIAIFLAGWQAFVKLGHVPGYALPAPWTVLRGLAEDPGFYLRNARATLSEASIGFSLAAIIALAIATVMAHSRFVERAVLPIAVLVQVTPIIAYAPAIVIWLRLRPAADHHHHGVGVLRALPHQRRRRLPIRRPQPPRAGAVGRRQPDRGVPAPPPPVRHCPTCSRRPASRSAWRSSAPCSASSSPASPAVWATRSRPPRPERSRCSCGPASSSSASSAPRPCCSSPQSSVSSFAGIPARGLSAVAPCT